MKANGDTENIQGMWEATAVCHEGKDLPEQALKMMKLRIEKGAITLQAGDKDRLMGSFRLDPSRSPRAIDVVAASGPDKGKTVEGIYELEGDTLRLCFNGAGNGRPKEFKSEEGSDGIQLTLKREKK